jgi:hypothetical protein
MPILGTAASAGALSRLTLSVDMLVVAGGGGGGNGAGGSGGSGLVIVRYAI